MTIAVDCPHKKQCSGREAVESVSSPELLVHKNPFIRLSWPVGIDPARIPIERVVKAYCFIP